MARLADLIVRIGADARQFEKDLGKIDKKLQRMGRQFRDVGQRLTTTFTLPIAGAGIAAGKLAIDFESAFAGVRKTVDATEPQFAELQQGIRGMAKEIPASATEIAGVAEAAGQLGIEVPNIMGFTRTMVDLGVATNLSSDQAATSLARLANITQMPQTEFDRLGSTVVALGNNLATTEAEIVEMGLRLAGAGSQVGMSEAQILGFAGALSSVGIEAEAGGSAISRVMINIANEVASGGENLQLFASVAGMTSSQFQQAFKEDAAGAIITFVEGLGRVSDSGENVFAVLDQLGLSEIRVRDALLRASGAGDLFRQSIELGSQAWGENTALTDEAAQRYGTTESQLTLLWNRLNDIGITIGEALVPAFMRFLDAADPLINAIERAANWFSELDPRLQTVTLSLLGLVAAIGPLLILIGLMVPGFGAVAAAAGTMSGAVATTATVVQGAWLKTAAISVANSVIAANAWALTASASIASATKQAVVAVPQIVASWLRVAGQAVVSTAVTLAQWALHPIASASAALSYVKNIGIMVAQWALLGAKSLLHAAKVAASWLIAMGPLGVVVGAITGLVVLVVKNWEKIRDATKRIWSSVVNFVGDKIRALLDFFKPVLNLLPESWRNALSNMGKAVSNTMSSAVSFVGNSVDSIKGSFSFAGDAADGLGDDMEDLLNQFDDMGSGANELADSMDGLGSVALPEVGGASGTTKSAVDELTKSQEKLKDATDETTESIVNQIKALGDAADAMARASGVSKAGLSGGQIRSLFLSSKSQDELRRMPEFADRFKVPALATGTNLVPRDMFALLHEGEAVVPKRYNPAAVGSGGTVGGGTANIIIELDGRVIARAIGQPLVDEIRVKTGVRI